VRAVGPGRCPRCGVARLNPRIGRRSRVPPVRSVRHASGSELAKASCAWRRAARPAGGYLVEEMLVHPDEPRKHGPAAKSKDRLTEERSSPLLADGLDPSVREDHRLIICAGPPEPSMTRTCDSAHVGAFALDEAIDRAAARAWRD